MPAMLIELGDINNEVQMKELGDDSKLDELCNAILKGVVEGGTN